MSETQFGRDLCATGRHDFEDGPACVRCGEAQVSAMPERVWVELGGKPNSTQYWVLSNPTTGTPYVPESRLLAAEARAADAEAAMHKYRRDCEAAVAQVRTNY